MPGKENQLFSIYILRLHLWNFTWQRLLSLEFCNKNINISAPSDNPSSEYSSSRYFPSSLSNMTRVMKWREEKRILGRWGNLGVRSYERSLIHHVTPQHHHRQHHQHQHHCQHCQHRQHRHARSVKSLASRRSWLNSSLTALLQCTIAKGAPIGADKLVIFPN